MQTMRVFAPNRFDGDRNTRYGSLDKHNWLMIGFRGDYEETLAPVRDSIRELNWAKYFVFTCGKIHENEHEEIDITDELRTHFRLGSVDVDLSACRIHVMPVYYRSDSHCMIRLSPQE